jgi:hypothetical protein
MRSAALSRGRTADKEVAGNGALVGRRLFGLLDRSYRGRKNRQRVVTPRGPPNHPYSPLGGARRAAMSPTERQAVIDKARRHCGGSRGRIERGQDVDAAGDCCGRQSH